MLTQIRHLAIGRAQARRGLQDEAAEIRSYIKALFYSNPILCQQDSGVAVLHSVVLLSFCLGTPRYYISLFSITYSFGISFQCFFLPYPKTEWIPLFSYYYKTLRLP